MEGVEGVSLAQREIGVKLREILKLLGDVGNLIPCLTPNWLARYALTNSMFFHMFPVKSKSSNFGTNDRREANTMRNW